MKVTSKKILAIILAVVMLIPIFAVVASAAEERTFVFNVNDLNQFAAGVKGDGESDKVGTEGYFTLYYAAKTKIDSSKDKIFSDGYNSTGAAHNRLNLQDKTSISDEMIKAAIGFNTSGRSTVTVWWDRQAMMIVRLLFSALTEACFRRMRTLLQRTKLA